MAEPIPFRRWRRRRLPLVWSPYLRRRHPPAAQIRLMIWAGLLIGLLAFQTSRLVPPPQFAPEPVRAKAPDPYAEARRSRAILDEQDGSPALPVAADDASGGSTASVRVIDGDTFDIEGVRVRVADIDTPEIHGRCTYETDLAARATQRMRSLLAAGPFELRPLPSGRDEDRYGRKLRIVTRGGHSLGDLLVAEGLARTWTGRREPWCV